MAKLITREDERRINKNFDEIISALERSELVINRDFFNEMQQKIERRHILHKEEGERLREYNERQRKQNISLMKAFFAGFIEAELFRKYPDMFDGVPYPQQFYITESIAEWIVDFFTESKYDYEKRIELRWYNRWYAKNVRRAKNKENLRNANKNAT